MQRHKYIYRMFRGDFAYNIDITVLNPLFAVFVASNLIKNFNLTLDSTCFYALFNSHYVC
jgi:hypothetical protein